MIRSQEFLPCKVTNLIGYYWKNIQKSIYGIIILFTFVLGQLSQMLSFLLPFVVFSSSSFSSTSSSTSSSHFCFHSSFASSLTTVSWERDLESEEAAGKSSQFIVAVTVKGKVGGVCMKSTITSSAFGRRNGWTSGWLGEQISPRYSIESDECQALAVVELQETV
jgi:uncharacterized membrane protein YjgN (DUF898 family)